uniref:Putative secreted protein n=1 Tax=Ixodes scapularis TaxID=6945 RepID=A0A4D5REG9_IXOSC
MCVQSTFLLSSCLFQVVCDLALPGAGVPGRPARTRRRAPQGPRRPQPHRRGAAGARRVRCQEQPPGTPQVSGTHRTPNCQPHRDPRRPRSDGWLR